MAQLIIDFTMGWSFGEPQVLLVQNKCQQRLVDLNPTAVVFDEAQFSKFVHEQIHTRARSADYFRQSLLGNIRQFAFQLVLRFSMLAPV
jgi:hypothetical protein